jgi:hypothetical protein
MGYPIYTQDQVNLNLEDSGTNAPVLPLSTSQAPTFSFSGASAVVGDNTRRNEETGEFYDATGLDSLAQTALGVGAQSEDNGFLTTALAALKINAAGPTNSGITPQDNILDKFASYTYSLSWYMLSVAQASSLKAAQRINTGGWSLLMQSGGASAAQASASPGTNLVTNLVAGILGGSSGAQGGRNKYFALDYYMDNLIIQSSFNNIAMSTVNKISFSVTEPNGITLLQNLAAAVKDMYKDSKVTAKDAIYVMVIKFYGYDSQGKMITASSSGGSRAAVTKYFPFKISNFEFKAANRAVEYMIEGLPLNDMIGKSSALGSVPQNYELVGVTVDDVLNGKAAVSNAAASDAGDRGAENKPSGNQGAPTNAPPLTSETLSTIGSTPYDNTDSSLGIGA